MLNRIRRTIALTRARYSSSHSPKGRHRRSLTPAGPPATPPFLMAADTLTLTLGRPSTATDHRDPLTVEDIALVRPYVLAWEKGVRSRSTVAVTRPTLVGAF